MPRELAVRKGQIWAYRQNKRSPLVPARVINQPEHYEATIMIRVLGESTPLAKGVRRSMLPCLWDEKDAYLDNHPDIPRELIAVPTEEQSVKADAADLFAVGEKTIRLIVREELKRALGVPKLALTYAEAAQATGYGVSTLNIAVSRGNLVPSYMNSKPVFAIAELERWIASLPNERS
jgi:hypothetical protein